MIRNFKQTGRLWRLWTAAFRKRISLSLRRLKSRGWFHNVCLRTNGRMHREGHNGKMHREEIYLASNFSKTCSSGEMAAIPFNPKCLQLMLRVGKCYPLSQRSRGDAPFRNDGIQPISSWAFLQCICQVRSSFRAASPSSSLFHFALGKILNAEHAVFAPNL